MKSEERVQRCAASEGELNRLENINALNYLCKIKGKYSDYVRKLFA